MDVLSGCRRHGETKAEAGGWQDSWCAGHRSVLRVVRLAVLVQILGRIVLVRFPVWILVRNARVRIPRASIPGAWTGKRQAGVPKGVPLAEQSLQDGPTPGRLVSAVPFDQPEDHSAGQSAEAFLKSETVAWRRI